MTKSIIVAALCTVATNAICQVNLTEKKPKESFDNILVEKLDGDSTFTSFVIWVKKSVKPHFHKEHAENIYVVEGTCTMTLGKETMNLKPGDYIHIPKGTVHSVEVTSNEPAKVLSIQSPKFDGKDRIFVTN